MGKKQGWRGWEESDHFKNTELNPTDNEIIERIQGKDSRESFLAGVVHGLEGSKIAGRAPWSGCNHPEES